MKTRFTTYDIVCSVTELQKLVGLRVNQCYDIDNKTYLIRFQQVDAKTVLLLESGNRFHTTAFEWPKNVAPSGFTMKLRKHLKNKRLEKLVQLGQDRIVDLQFGMGEAAYHVILELYDKGNIILTDHEMTILNILRPHVEGEEEVRFAVREKYPEHRAKMQAGPGVTMEELREIILNGKSGDYLKKVLNPVLSFGPQIIEHVLIKHNLSNIQLPTTTTNETTTDNKNKSNKKQKNKQNVGTARIWNMDTDLPILMNALNDASDMIQEAQTRQSKGYIIYKKELRPSTTNDGEKEEHFEHNIEYNPYVFAQNADQPYKEFDSFDAAVDEFYSKYESQKIDVKTMAQERDALKKLSNVKKDHLRRLDDLSKTQLFDKHRAELITRNQNLVDNAILAIRSAIANQLPWPEIQNLVKAAQAKQDAVATSIRHLKLETNHISMYLTDPYDYEEGLDDDRLEPLTIDIDLGMSAYANATRYYDQKKNAAKKQQRTLESSTKALKSAERKTQQSLKEMRSISTISKARKTYWFEKFYWFISTENYLIIGGRDQQQNELIVKRYMRATDIYVHAEIQGASSVVIRNPTGKDVPPKTLLEAGTMAISYSVAWDAKVVTNAYWVRSNQVSKTAPTGEYLGTGSFMIRGKKNFLPPCHLILGMSFLFKLEESSVARHAGERRVRTFEEDAADAADEVLEVENEKLDEVVEEQEIELLDSDDELPKTETEEIDSKISAVQLDSDDDDDSKFPDTHINIEHSTGRVSLTSDPVLERLKSIDETSTATADSVPFIIHTGAATKIKQQKKDRDARKGKRVQIVQEPAAEDEKPQSNQPKRGQKSKLKKIQNKYKDQDEEEKRIRMEILKSAGNHKKVAAKPKETSTITTDQQDKQQKDKFSKKQTTNTNTDAQDADGDDGGDEATAAGADVEMIDSLTGLPMDEDELLFAIPVIAPYQALQNYKYKVKITPGTGRRGKASKTAVQIFMRDKACSLRERDLLKGVKDDAVARNIPGKVKLSAPQLHKYKK